MKKEKPPPIPMEQADSVRQQIVSLLRENNFSARELSAEVRIPEKEVYDHLRHIKKSAGHLGLNLTTHSAQCSRCDFAFVKREKLKKPSRCPACGSEQIKSPRFEMNEV